MSWKKDRKVKAQRYTDTLTLLKGKYDGTDFNVDFKEMKVTARPNVTSK